MNDAATEPTADLIRGIGNIAKHLQMTKRQAYHLHEQGHLPTFKLGHIVFARRSALADHFAAQEAAARAGQR